MKNHNYLLFAVASLCILAITVFSCNKEKPSTCKECEKPSFQEIKKFADFVGSCHNAALDVELPIIKQCFQKGETFEIDSIVSMTKGYLKEQYANFCSVQIDETVSSKMNDIENEYKHAVPAVLDSLCSTTYLSDFLDAQMGLTVFEKNTILRIIDICHDTIDENRTKELASIRNELDRMGCESELLYYSISIAQASNEYWTNHISDLSISKRPRWEILANTISSDIVGAIGSVLVGGWACTGTLVFGPGGIVSCVGGVFLFGGISSSLVAFVEQTAVN